MPAIPSLGLLFQVSSIAHNLFRQSVTCDSKLGKHEELVDDSKHCQAICKAFGDEHWGVATV